MGVGPAHPGPGPSITHRFPPHLGSPVHYGPPSLPYLPPYADDDEEGTVQLMEAALSNQSQVIFIHIRVLMFELHWNK